MVILSDRYGTTKKWEKDEENVGKPCLPVLTNYIVGGSINIGILRLLCI